MNYIQSNLMKKCIEQHRFLNPHIDDIMYHLNCNFEGIDYLIKTTHELIKEFNDEMFWVLYEICIHYGSTISKYSKTIEDATSLVDIKNAMSYLNNIKTTNIDKIMKLKIIKYFNIIFHFIKNNKSKIIEMEIENY